MILIKSDLEFKFKLRDIVYRIGYWYDERDGDNKWQIYKNRYELTGFRNVNSRAGYRMNPFDSPLHCKLLDIVYIEEEFLFYKKEDARKECLLRNIQNTLDKIGDI